MFRYKGVLLTLGVILLLGIAAYIALTIQIRQETRAELAVDLKIPSLPASVQEVSCRREPVMTDVLFHCYFEIDPSDFPALLAGHKYKVSDLKTTSHDVFERITEYGDLGKKFDIAKRYFVEPREYKDGGSITIYTDAAQRHIIYDLYIE